MRFRILWLVPQLTIVCARQSEQGTFYQGWSSGADFAVCLDILTSYLSNAFGGVSLAYTWRSIQQEYLTLSFAPDETRIPNLFWISCWICLIRNGTIQSPYQTSSKVYLALKEWLSASESRIMWIYGPSRTDKPSNISAASAFVVSMITHAKAPLIAHRCQNSGSAMEALISMVYSVIIQLVWLLPDKFPTGTFHFGVNPSCVVASSGHIASFYARFRKKLPVL